MRTALGLFVRSILFVIPRLVTVIAFVSMSMVRPVAIETFISPPLFRSMNLPPGCVAMAMASISSTSVSNSVCMPATSSVL